MRAFPVDWSRLFFLKGQTATDILFTVEHPFDPEGTLGEDLEDFLCNIGAKNDFDQLLVLVDATANKMTDIIVDYNKTSVTYEDDVEDMLKAWWDWLRLLVYAEYVAFTGDVFADEVEP